MRRIKVRLIIGLFMALLVVTIVYQQWKIMKLEQTTIDLDDQMSQQQQDIDDLQSKLDKDE